jgi:hypothetical protein
LPRFIDTNNISSLVFEAWVTGVAACLPRRTTRGGSSIAGPYHLPTGQPPTAWTDPQDFAQQSTS